MVNVAAKSAYQALSQVLTEYGGNSWELKNEFLKVSNKKVEIIADDTDAYIQKGTIEWDGKTRQTISLVFINPEDDTKMVYIPVWGKPDASHTKFAIQKGAKKDGSKDKWFAVAI